MAATDVTAVLNKPSSKELLARDIARLSYVAPDGTPRVIPIGFTWNGTEVVMCSPTNAPKLTSLRKNPAVALTIDTEVHPPTPEQRLEWEQGWSTSAARRSGGSSSPSAG